MNDTSSIVHSVLSQWVAIIPLLAVYVAGIVVALLQMPRHPLPSALVLTATISLTLVSLFQPIASAYVTTQRSDLRWSFGQLQFAFLAISLVAHVARAASFGLLLMAVYHRRPSITAPLPPPR